MTLITLRPPDLRQTCRIVHTSAFTVRRTALRRPDPHLKPVLTQHWEQAEQTVSLRKQGEAKRRQEREAQDKAQLAESIRFSHD